MAVPVRRSSREASTTRLRSALVLNGRTQRPVTTPAGKCSADHGNFGSALSVAVCNEPSLCERDPEELGCRRESDSGDAVSEVI